MGWFDKKSWQLRRKIRDLQSELAVAEREGKYVVAQGLFFAELQEMGNATMMVLGAADHLDPEEAGMIKTFFERNGFSVESLRLDKTQKNLAAVEIIPPEEFTRRVAKVFKEQGFKLIDDSDNPRDSSLENRVVTLSFLIRSISTLFANHVHQLIVSTPLKMNMEGNRLLHWLPLIRDELSSRVSPELLTECRKPFVEAYNRYYGRFGKMEDFGMDLEVHDDPNDGDNPLSAMDTSTPWSSNSDSAETYNPGQTRNASSLFSTTAVSTRLSESANTSAPELPANAATVRALDAAQTLTKMYKALIGASPQRKTRNAEALLEYIDRFFNAKAACIILRKTPDNILTLMANSGAVSCVTTNAEGAVSCTSNTLEQCLATSTICIGPPANGNSNPPAVAAPLLVDSVPDAVLYLVEPQGFTSDDQSHLTQFIQVFREFPDLLISSQQEKK